MLLIVLTLFPQLILNPVFLYCRPSDNRYTLLEHDEF
jgi:hypothetical protein